MEKAKKVIIFILINIFILGITVIMPLIPAFEFYNVYHYEDIPSNVKVETDVGIQTSFFASFRTVVNDLNTQEGKEAFSKALGIMMFERGDILYENFVCVYLMLGFITGIMTIIIGIMLKYKSKNKIYAISVIVAGMLVVIFYIFLLSILLQKNTYYGLVIKDLFGI